MGTPPGAVSVGLLRPYQEEALRALTASTRPFKALIMPTGSGKTRVALKYAEARMAEGRSVSYITESDALAQQVIREAEAVDVPAVWIPGAASAAGTELSTRRQALIQDYDAGLHVGVFSYAGYFLGSQVPAAQTLFIDDAHALVSQNLSLAVVEMTNEDFPALFGAVVDLIKAANPMLRHQIEALDRPVHRGGNAVLVPPMQDEAAKQAVFAHVTSAAAGSGFPRFLLGRRLAASPFFLSWPCVVTSSAVCWRPFIIPFHSLGGPASQQIREGEVVLVTSTRGTDDFLQIRLGLPSAPEILEVASDEMGTRAVLAYPAFRSHASPSTVQTNIINDWVERFGSVLVTVTADSAGAQLASRIDSAVQVLRYQGDESLDAFATLPAPKILLLVNRPSGIDIPVHVCRVAIHLDLPYSSSGHEVVAGDVERTGAVSEASLAIRMSQLLGRLNRGPVDRSVHLVLAGPLPLRRGTVFTKSLDPGVLLDLLIGDRGIARRYDLPNDADLLTSADAFLHGNDALRAQFLLSETEVRRRYLQTDSPDYRPSGDSLVEANLLLSRGNFSPAGRIFGRLALEANHAGSNAKASFYDYLYALCGAALGASEHQFFGSSSLRGVVDGALARNPGSSVLLGALQQFNAEQPVDATVFQDRLLRLQLKQRSLAFYERWLGRNEETLPRPDRRGEVQPWLDYWRQRLVSPVHSDLLNSYCEAFELLGCETEPEVERNDARVNWDSLAGTRSIALEIKGRVLPQGGEESELGPDDVIQARDNALRIDADFVLLATSRSARHRDVPGELQSRAVLAVLAEASLGLAEMIARQCVTLEGVRLRRQAVTQVPFESLTLETLFQKQNGEITLAEVRALIARTLGS